MTNRRELSAADWRQLVASLEASGQTLKDFATEQGVKRAELWTWRQRVAEERADAGEATAQPVASPPPPALSARPAKRSKPRKAAAGRYVRSRSERDADFVTLIDTLASSGSAKLGHLQDVVGRDRQVVRKMLKDAEALGIVYRTGDRSTTVWHLG